MTSVLITGGLGLVGSSLAVRLAEMGRRVAIVDNLDPRAGGAEANVPAGLLSETILADIRDSSVWERIPSDVSTVVNLAGLSGHAYSMSEPTEDLSANVLAQAAFLAGMRRCLQPRLVVLASTRQIYGVNPAESGRIEAPADVNAVSRLAVEQLHEVLLRGSGTATIAVRLSNVYGRAMLNAETPQGVLGHWLRRAARSEDLIVTQPSPVRDLLHVDDLVDLLVRIIDGVGSGDVLNRHFDVGGAVGVQLSEVARHIAQVAKVQLVEESAHASQSQFAVGDYVSDVAEVSRLFGWVPRTEWRYGLAKIVDQSLSDTRRGWA